MNRSSLTLVYVLISLVAAARLLPHPENITAIGALGLFAGAYLPQRSAWLLPLGALLIGDAAMGFYSLVVMLFVYIGFAASAVVGRGLLFQRRTPARLGAAVLTSAALFFLLSNFGMWLATYPHSGDGLVSCYLNGIPYFGRSLLGDLFYSLLLFGSYETLFRYFPRHPDAART